MKKYIIYPGYIASKNDDDLHYINADKLIQLYNVKKSECWVVYDERGNHEWLESSSLIELFPLRNGNYKECLKYLLEENKQSMCKNCKHVENKIDSTMICCTLHDETYKDDKQIIFCSAKEQAEK